MASRKHVRTKARLRRAAERDEPLGVLLRLTGSFSDSEPLEEALRRVTDAALKIVGGNHASIRLLDASLENLACGARSGEGDTQPPVALRRGTGVIGWVVERGEGALISDTRSDPRFVIRENQGFVVRSLVAEPLWSAGAVIGVLSVSSSRPHAFDETARAYVRLLANCCTPSIDRARLRRLALTDDLTLTYNHRYLRSRIREEVERSKRHGTPLSVLVIDLDHFKSVNDDFGHATGDAALRGFADRLRTVVRRVDVIVRQGGEEFLVIMPGTTRAQAAHTAERIRADLDERALELEGRAPLHQTASFGVATFDGDESPESLVDRADWAMYRAKQAGRNRVAVARIDESPPSHARPHRAS